MDQTITVCKNHQSLFWEYVDEFGIDVAMTRIREGREACGISWTVSTTTTLSTNSTHDGSR
jgi:hypothetical protein